MHLLVSLADEALCLPVELAEIALESRINFVSANEIAIFNCLSATPAVILCDLNLPITLIQGVLLVRIIVALIP